LQAGQFDTEALWRVVSPQLLPGRPVLLLRGSDGDKPATDDDDVFGLRAACETCEAQRASGASPAEVLQLCAHVEMI
jgi:hypothetical protein